MRRSEPPYPALFEESPQPRWLSFTLLPRRQGLHAVAPGLALHQAGQLGFGLFREARGSVSLDQPLDLSRRALAQDQLAFSSLSDGVSSTGRAVERVSEDLPQFITAAAPASQ